MHIRFQVPSKFSAFWRWATEVQKLIDKKNNNLCMKKKYKSEAIKQKYKTSKIVMENAIELEIDEYCIVYNQNILKNINNCDKKRCDAMRVIINRMKM